MSWVNPSTLDYVLKDGQFRPVPDTVEQEVFFRLTIHRGTWLDDPDMGSRLWTLELERVPSRAAVLAPPMVREALQSMTDSGAILDLTVATAVITGGLEITIRLTDSGDRPYRFQLFQQVGGS